MLSGPDFTDLGAVAQRTAISYNADNMPTSITHSTGGTVIFTYDGEGRRAKKVRGASSTLYIGEHYEVINGTATKYIFAGNLRIAKVSTGGTLYFHKDHLGSSTVMTDDGTGSAETTEYMPFSSMRDHTGADLTAYKYTDQELDTETGLYNYKARFYDPVIGRFISADIVIPDLYNPQSLNRYSYCINNPLIYVDPNGQNYGGYGDAETAASAETGMDASFDSSGAYGLSVQSMSSVSLLGIFGDWSAVLSDPGPIDDQMEEFDVPSVYTIGFVTEYGLAKGITKGFGIAIATDPPPGEPHIGLYEKIGGGVVVGKQAVFGVEAGRTDTNKISDLDGWAASYGGSFSPGPISVGGDYNRSLSGETEGVSVNFEVGPSSPEGHGYVSHTKTKGIW